MSEKTSQSSNQETATEKRHTDAEFRRWCLAVGLCADDVALIMAVDKPADATQSRARR
jgi:hypothetical protein